MSGGGRNARDAEPAGLHVVPVLLGTRYGVWRSSMIHTVQYSGFPRALNAIRVVTDTLIENGTAIPEPLGRDA